jgi:hypothetical protein
VIEFPAIHFDKWRSHHKRGDAMLAEKFFLVLETLKSHASDGSVKVVSNVPHVPVKLPPQK